MINDHMPGTEFTVTAMLNKLEMYGEPVMSSLGKYFASCCMIFIDHFPEEN